MLRLSTHSVPGVCVCVCVTTVWTSHHHQEDRLSHTDRILMFVVFFSFQPCSSLSDDLFLVTVSPLFALPAHWLGKVGCLHGRSGQLLLASRFLQECDLWWGLYKYILEEGWPPLLRELLLESEIYSVTVIASDRAIWKRSEAVKGVPWCNRGTQGWYVLHIR